jgi:hypothetical protein
MSSADKPKVDAAEVDRITGYVKAAAAQIVALIHASPRSPGEEEIGVIIAKAWGAAPVEEMVGADWTPHPVTFDYTNVEFGLRFLPWVRLAFCTIQHDKAGTLATVRKLFADNKDGEKLFRDATEAWDQIADKFHALGDLVRAAHSRYMLAAMILAEQDDEIDAPISEARQLPAPTPRQDDATGLARWADAVARFLDDSAAGDEAYDRAEQPFEATLLAIWATPVRSWDDLLTRAAIAVHWNSPCGKTEPAYPDWVLVGHDIKVDIEFGYDQLALAHVVRGILDLAGLTFDPEGRLLSGPTRGNARHG